jgi:NAD+ kinase
MNPKFRQIALIGKYQTLSSGATGARARNGLEEIASFLLSQGCEVTLEKDTAANMGVGGFPVLDLAEIGARCDLGLVVGGDGTMLGIGRQLARFGLPLIGINQGRLGFITDVSFEMFQKTLAPMLAGDYEEDQRSLMNAKVWRDGRCVFDALAMNEVVVNRGATSGMVELRVEVDGRFVANQRADGVMVPIAPHTLSNRPVVLSNSAEIAITLVAGRDASANFDMQSLASLLKGDRILVTRSQHHVRFLHPKGWTYFDNLRQKLHWNEGVA